MLADDGRGLAARTVADGTLFQKGNLVAQFCELECRAASHDSSADNDDIKGSFRISIAVAWSAVDRFYSPAVCRAKLRANAFMIIPIYLPVR